MLFLLSLLACNPEKGIDDPLATTDGPAVGDAKRAEGSGSQIATRVERGAERSRPARPAPPRPTGAALVHSDCYGGGGEGALGSGGGMGYGGASGRGAAPMKKPTAARPREASNSAGPPPPSAPPAAAPMDLGGGFAEGEASAAPARLAEKQDALGASRERPAADPAPEAKRERRELAAADEAAVAAEPELAKSYAPREPTWDWGATVYLSNDDSMSLASAQRLLWAVDQRRPFSPSEVRPHELLNYFSFDTAPVADGELFSVLGAAEQDGDTLSVALAVQGATPPRQPLDLTMVIDRSGSMSAEGRMDYVRRGLLRMVDELGDGDRVDLVLFDSSACSPLQNFVVGRDDLGVLKAEIGRMRPRGGTNIDAGLTEGYRIQTARTKEDTHGRNRRVMLLTDAMANQGRVDPNTLSEIGRQLDENGIRVTGVGVGRDFNDAVLDKITEKGKGAYVYLGSEAVVDRVFGAGFDSLVQTIAHDVRFSIHLPESLAMKRFYGEESSTVAADIQPIHYYAGTSQVFLQDLKVRDGRADPSAPVRFQIAYRDARTGEPHEKTFTTTVGALLAGDAHNLDKAQALMKWTDVLAGYAMGDRSCGALGAYRSAASAVQGDAEVAYVSSLTGKLCGVDMSQTVAATGVSFKVKLDADLPIPEVRLACSGDTRTTRLSASDTVARFENVSPGSCDLVLEGNVPMRASVKVPQTGGDVRCLVRAGRVSCG